MLTLKGLIAKYNFTLKEIEGIEHLMKKKNLKLHKSFSEEELVKCIHENRNKDQAIK